METCVKMNHQLLFLFCFINTIILESLICKKEICKEICDDIIKYIEKYHKNYEVIEDRKTAILKAIHEATSDDVIALLGKGDENYQMIDGEWLPYETDIVVVENELNKVKE